MTPFTTDAIEVVDDTEAYYALSLAEKWGDGAPLLPPTDARIAALLAATPLPADHVLGMLAPRYGKATVELAAVNAAMAGCLPQAFPHVLAVQRLRHHHHDLERHAGGDRQRSLAR